jgi:Integrase core domain
MACPHLGVRRRLLVGGVRSPGESPRAARSTRAPRARGKPDRPRGTEGTHPGCSSRVRNTGTLSGSGLGSGKPTATELTSDRVWRTHDQAELAIVEWVGWFNHQRLHSSLGDIPPAECEQHHAVAHGSISFDGPGAALAPKGEVRTRRVSRTAVAVAANGQISPVDALTAPTGIRSGRDNGGQKTNGHPGLSDRWSRRHTR